MKFVKFFHLLVIGTLFGGCVAVKMNATKVNVKHLSYNKKTIVFIPMIHIGKASYYAHVKDQVDKWRDSGYVFLYEGVKSSKDTLDYLKWRKLSGGISIKDDSIVKMLNESIFFNDLIKQPENAALGLKETDIWADVTNKLILEKYESSYGEIELDSCDYKTPVGVRYTCNSLDTRRLRPLVVDFRNNALFSNIHTCEQTKIAVVYGKGHYKGLKKLTKEHDVKGRKSIDHAIARNYFVKNTISEAQNLKIESQEQFDSFFGIASIMDSTETFVPIDFTKQFVLAIVLPASEFQTTIDLVSLKRGKNGSAHLTYCVFEKEIQSFSSQQAMIIVVDKRMKREVKFLELYATVSR